MFFNYVTILGLLSFISGSFCFNALLISIGHAGHVIPLFELAKQLKNHNVTFLTQPLAQSFIDFNSYPNTSSFHVIFTNDSSEAFNDDKLKMQKLISYSANNSFFNGLRYTSEIMHDDFYSLLTKTIHILMTNKFDVIIVNSLLKMLNVLGQETNTPCVIQGTESLSSMLDFNLPNSFTLLSREQMTHLKYRIYNVIYTLRIGLIFITKLAPMFYSSVQSYPKIPGPFYDSFSISKLLSTKSRCLELYSIAPTFHIPSYTDHYTKYLGAFIDETTIESKENELTKWVQSKAENSIIYGAFGTSSLIPLARMKNLIDGLAEFLIQTSNSHLLLVFGGRNYPTYQTVLNEMNDQQYLNIFNHNQRVRIENQFVEQKWILQQNSVKLFLSHCGMGSCSEGVYFQKPILCMPFNMDQFINAIAIDHSSIGLSLFEPPSLFQSFLNPSHFHEYKFSSESVTRKLSNIWNNDSYQKMVRIMSLEMKHAGGLKQAVKEIEFLVELEGNLDRYAPFQSTLPFYQRYLLDLIFVFIILPIIIVIYGLKKCCKQRRKVKND